MLVEKSESANREVRESANCVVEKVLLVLLVLSRECGLRERERWIRGDENCKLTI